MQAAADLLHNVKSSLLILHSPHNVKSSPLIWHSLHNTSVTVKILSIFVAFLENTNFKDDALVITIGSAWLRTHSLRIWELEKRSSFLIIVVCYPFYACERELPNLNNAKWPQRSPVDKDRVLKYSLGVICFSILYCLPTFWEYKVGYCDENTPIERYESKVYGS